MRLSRTTLFVLACLCACVETSAQHLEVKGVRKKSKASDCATIVFKSDFDDLKVISMSSIRRRDVNITTHGHNM